MRGEFDRIERLARRFGTPPAPAVGIGDDCAILPNAGAATVLTVDAAVEGVHFAREWIALDLAAERAMEAAMSDVAAMGASVSYGTRGGAGILCAWTLPTDLSDGDFDALVEGTARAAERAGAMILGGNLSAGAMLSLTTTVIGRLDGPAMRRGGARVGDALYATGPLGAAALGLAALRAGRSEEPVMAPFVAAWRSPRARLDAGILIAPFATAAIDVSDGLAQDAGHVAKASGVAIVLDADSLPMHSTQRETARALGLDAVDLALAGGEDYELLITAPAELATPAGISLHRIGDVVAGDGVFVHRNATTTKFTRAGFDHFARG